MPKYINVSFNAWEYNGTDLLWASILEKIWTEVEKEFGKFAVRSHRASIAISGETDDDDTETRQNKRQIALFRLKATSILWTMAALIITILPVVLYRDRIAGLGGKFWIWITADVVTVLGCLVKLKTLIAPMFRLSKGRKFLMQARGFEKHKRTDFTKKTGFMGEVKKEVGFLFDFIKTTYIDDHVHQIRRLVRLSLFVDDLDRCQAQTIMAVLEAVMLLLLVDAPLTCWLAIESRLVVASIEAALGATLMQEGLDGYKYLDKIVQLPFCIPDLNKYHKSNFLRKIFEKDELDPIRVCDRLRYLYEIDVQDIKDLFDISNDLHQDLDDESNEAIPLVSNEGDRLIEELKNKKPTIDEAFVILIPVLESMIDRKHLLEEAHDVELALIKSPKKVLEEVKAAKAAMSTVELLRDRLGDQLKEEFLHFVSIGIETILRKGKIEDNVKDNPPSTINKPVTSTTRVEVETKPTGKIVPEKRAPTSSSLPRYV